MPSVLGKMQHVPRRTPIACLNCANAKAGCDKGVPCTRCYEKNLPCEARFARRISKIAVRAAATASISPVDNGIPVQLGNIDIEMNRGGNSFRDEHLSPIHTHPVPTPITNGVLSFPDNAFFRPTQPIDNAGLIDFSDNFSSPNMDFQEFMSWGGDYNPMVIENFRCAKLSPQLEGFDMPMSDLSESSSSPFDRRSGSSRDSISTAHTGHSSHASHSHTPSLSTISSKPSFIDPTIMGASDSEFEAVIAAENAWPLARCNKPIFSDTCPRTAIVHLETLEHNSQNAVVWETLTETPELAARHSNSISVVPLNPTTRDKILAVTQSFLHKALNTHRGRFGWPKAGQLSPGGGFSILVLPPTETLEFFLQNYVQTLTSYYSLINGGMVDPNELILNNRASTLLVLLMIAQGATAIASPEARQLTAGLTETCRISLFDLIEKDVELSADPIVLRCALLFIMLAAWSGDKWHMDMAMGQRGMYISMLKHGGMMEAQPQFTPIFDNCSSKDLQWRTWVRRETKIRLVYNWVMVDQELSLFHDTPCVLSTTEIQAPIPSHESLWLAKDADDWLAAFYNTRDLPEHRGSQSTSLPHSSPSLGDLFQDLLQDNTRSHGQLTPLQLKLLLHPLHSLVFHLRHILGCFSDGPGSHRGSRTVTKTSTMSRLEEVQSLLQKWYGLCMLHANDESASPIIQENLVLYHLISLNAVASFPDIERVARREQSGGHFAFASAQSKRCIYRREEALFHCGQVFRLINNMPKHCRPHWWPAAVYRATMIVWMYAISQNSAAGAHKMSTESIFAIDTVTPEHPSVTSYLWNGEGIPVLSLKDGGFVELDQPGQVLEHCTDLFTEGISGRMSDGIRRKLQTLYSNWCIDTPEAFAQ